jgi:Na+-transporting methylmalonyl-CoA/oxaloacetate decarboxylase gamma subunit
MAATPKKEEKKSFWDDWGIIIASIGFGLAFIFLCIIIYLVWMRPTPATVAPDVAPAPSLAPASSSSSIAAQKPETLDMDGKYITDPTYEIPREGPLRSPLRPPPPQQPGQAPMGRVDGGKKAPKGLKALKARKGRMGGGCGCTGIADTPM